MNGLGKFSIFLSAFCLLITLGFKMALPGWIPFIGWGLGFGLFFLLFALLINLKWLYLFLDSDVLKFLTKSFLQVMLVFSVLALINFVLYKQQITRDLTDKKIHSLSKLSQALVRALPEPLEFYYLHVGDEAGKKLELQIHRAIDPYMRETDQVKFYSYSIFERPDLMKKLRADGTSLYMEFKGRIERISQISEREITNALLKLTKPPKKVYFIQGHGERKWEDASHFGLKQVKEQLERLHYKVEALKSFLKIPEDASVLVMVGPRLAMSPDEMDSLEKYLGAGGALLLAVDPGEDHQVNPFLKKYGMSLNEAYAFSEQPLVGESPWLVLASAGEKAHPITEDLWGENKPAFFMASSLELKKTKKDILLTPFLKHLPKTQFRKNLEQTGSDFPSLSVVLGALAEGRKNSWFRMAVVADSDFIINGFFSRPGNFDLFLGLMNYLSRDEDLLKLKPPRPKTTYLILSQTHLNLFILFFVLPMMGLFFLVALFFKLRRLF